MNNVLERKEAELKARGKSLDLRLNNATSQAEIKTLEAEMQKWLDECDHLDWEKSRSDLTGKNAKLKAFGADRSSTNGHAPAEIVLGAEANPLRFSENSVKSIYDALQKRQSVSVKAFSTVESLIPPQLAPGILEKLHENRLLDYLPVQSITAPSYEIIVHNSTTGAPAPVAEGALKPEVVLNTTEQTLTAIKLAAHVGISYESIADYPTFYGYAQQEVIRQIGDVENSELLTGSGTGGHMTGFLSTSGILTHDASADTGTNVTALDSIEMAITQLRTGSAFAEANLIVLHPNSFSALRRLKNTLGNFLIGDPTDQGARELFGVRVLVTTSIAAGTGLILDTTKFGRVLLREGITTHAGQTNDDFTRNIARIVMEERLVLAVERPSAVLAISNLPTAP
ncbi:phage major capsid protein [Mycobacterium paraterrae]|uniref:Phage major capsid protein n=1 Tax=Mycobacterium paraterrae TaxID=577492 RepID=A0ABY3VQN2_9MYCO|nr:phage major capsid protein [Mycobacterium paraterrae]UMB71763.1 phage major capsid protein [Mycobacterium paraterrae]